MSLNFRKSSIISYPNLPPVYSYNYEGFIFETYAQKPTNFPLVQVNQTHSCLQVNINCAQKDQSNHMSQADTINFHESDLDNLIPTIKTADCLPIWVITNKKQYLIHAGWRGLADSIIQKTIKDEEIKFAFIGPSICSQCFEVQEDFRVNFPKSYFFQNFDIKLTFDLQKQASLHLEKSFKRTDANINIQHAQLCTYEHESLHSFRFNTTTQRNWSIVRRAS